MEEDIRLQARMLEQMSEGVFLFNAQNGTIIYANGGGERLFDCKKGELSGQHLSFLLAPSDKGQEETISRITSDLAQHGNWQGEIRNLKKDGSPFWFLGTFSTFTHPVHGEVWMAVFQDITGRKQAEEKLKERTDFLDKIIDSSALSMWISDEKGTAIRANPACLQFFGTTEEEVIGKYNILQDNVVENNGLMPVIKQVFEKGKAASFVLDYDFGAVGHVEVKKPTHKIVRSVLTPVVDKAGRVTNLISQAIDLTEIQQKEDALRASEKRFRQLTENIQEVFWLGSPDWQEVIYISPAYEQIWGRSTESLYAQPLSWLEAVLEEDRESVLTDIRKKSTGELNDGKIPEYRIRRPDGSVRWISARAYPIKDEQKTIIRIAGIAEDITRRKQAEDSAKKAALEWSAAMDAS
ncbi:MAG: PAS domain S-box protein [Desulfobulbaceae bacterium]|nr:PAS domain S-box protein [Desulfobulbaceae bacterium]